MVYLFMHICIIFIMTILRILKILLILIVAIFTPIFLFQTFRYFSKAENVPADIVVDTRKIIGFIYPNWKALAQGGEEKGVQMLQNVIPDLQALAPRYIRIDHIYDFYDVVTRDQTGQLVFNWTKLDATVCDIYSTQAKPFFVLGYMPPVLSDGGSLIDKPKNWNDWSQVVQKTIEHFSRTSTRICNQLTNNSFEDIYYEVWNEPDLESFGDWSLYGGSKDYKTLYYYSVLGASKAQNVNHYLIGGPVTTSAYRNWFTVFADYILANNLRIDFLSWHHYSKNPDDFSKDLINLNQWLTDDKYIRFRHLPKIISEWAYDSNYNPVSETDIGAAHTVVSIRNLIEQQLELAFAFEIKDGLNPSWGLLTYKGQKKPRYFALKILNLLDRARLQITGEGTFVRAIASSSYNKTTLILVNYDQNNTNNEIVPVTFINLTPGAYIISERYPNEKNITRNFLLTESTLKKSVVMRPNSIVAIELVKQ